MIELKGNNTQYSGGKAELIFAHWCREVQATPTKTDFDEVGVDFTVTFPSPDREVVALDVRKPELVCLVQVKGSSTLTDSVTMAYGKLQALISNPLPAFVVLINYNKERAETMLADEAPADYANWPERAYVMPLDEDRITEILRDLREAETDILAKHKTLKARPGEEIRTNGHSMRQAIRRQVGNYMQYVRQKTVWWERTGYGEDAYLLSVQVSATSEQLADFAIGLPMPVNLISIQDNRFQIPRELPVKMSEGFAQFSKVPPSAEDVKLRFVSDARSLSAEFVCEMYHPHSLFPDLEPGSYRIRLKTDNADFFLNPAQNTVTANLNLGALAPLDFWRNISNILQMFDGGPLRMILEHGDSSSDDPVNSLGAAPTLPVSAQALHFAIAAANKITEEFGQQVGLVSLDDLMNQFDSLRKMCCFLTDKRPGFSVSASSDILAELDGKDVALALAAASSFGGFFFTSVFVVHGIVDVTRAADEWVEIAARTELVQSIVRPASGEPPPAKPLLAKAREWAKERDMRAILPGEPIKLKLHPVAKL